MKFRSQVTYGECRFKILLFTAILIVSGVFSAGCSSASPRSDLLPDIHPLPREFKRNGLISSSTYQVVVDIETENSDRAAVLGQGMAREKAMHLILQEAFVNRNISAVGKSQIEKLIEMQGKIVKVQQVEENLYSVVYQIQKLNLRHSLQQLR